MGRKKGKGRSVTRNPNIKGEATEVISAPHSFVIHKGLPGGHTLELTKDFRRVMEPFTAASLKERKKNTIKDFVSVAGPLHVSHMVVFSRTETGMYMKITRLPRGPTLTFKIHNFSLARDVVSSLKKQSVVEEAFKHSPLIVLNSFSGEGLHMKLMASMFQNMFPTINLTNVDLNTIRRCVLMNYNPTTKLIDFRHYNIKVAPVGISKGVKKVVQGKVPNLARCDDIAEYFMKAGLLSESEAEDDPSNHVTLPQKIISRGNIESAKSAVRLTELGPRLTIQLIKIEDGLMDGEVLYHDLIQKSEEEKLEIQKKREQKRKLKEKRKKIQEENKKAKEKIKEEHKEKSLKGMLKNEAEKQDDGENIQSNESNKNAIEDDDREYYREEVGEEPDVDLFTKKPFGQKRKSNWEPSYKTKKFKSNEDRRESNKKSSRDFKMTFKTKQSNFDNKQGFKSKFNKNKNKFGDDDRNNRKFKDRKGQNEDRKFKKGKPRKRVDKTNSHKRDHRPMGGNKFKKNWKR